MTAKLVSNQGRDENGERVPMSEYRAQTMANIPQFAESIERLLLRDSRDGQLWEREAERETLSQDTLTTSQWERMAWARNYMGTRRPGLDGDARGPLAANHAEGWVSNFASGILHPITWGLDSFDAAE